MDDYSDSDEAMDMDQHQRKFVDIGRFDRRKVDLTKTAMSAQEHLRQVIVQRETIPMIAQAANYEEILQKASTSSISVANRVNLQNGSATATGDKTSRFAPDKEWRTAKCNEFSRNRSLFEAQKAPPHLLKDIKLPSVGDSQGWCQICFEHRLEVIKIGPQFEARFAHHKGTPPTLGLVKSLNDNQINFLIEHQTEYINERGQTRASLEWMYALLLAVKKPLVHEVCSSLREFCRKCREWRSELDEDDSELIHELSWFIAIISIYFAQRDLADE